MIETALGLISPLVDPISVPELSIVVATMVLAGFMRGFVGFGSALIIIMIFSAIFGPVVAVAISCLIGLPAVFLLIPTAIRHSERAFLLPFAIPAFIAAPFGTLVLVSTDPVLMKIAISLFILAAVGTGWPVLLIFAPIWYIFMKTQTYYVPTARSLRRLDAVNKSPLFSHIAETLNGLSTIRVHKLQQFVSRDNV